MTSPPGRLPWSESAPAKLTFSLRITGCRDDGYHLLEAEMATLDLADTLSFSEGDGVQVRRVVEAGTDVPEGPDNLVARALQLVGRRALVRVEKAIPAGGGLGGGSADAATVLRWAGVDDPALAARLGADVPFWLRGGRARVTGVGEILEPLSFLDRRVVLLTPPFGVSTAAVYAAFDRLGSPDGDGSNDLEAAAMAVEPRLADWRDLLARITGFEPVLAGSGSTWFCEVEEGFDAGVLVRWREKLAGRRATLIAARTVA